MVLANNILILFGTSVLAGILLWGIWKEHHPHSHKLICL